MHRTALAVACLWLLAGCATKKTTVDVLGTVVEDSGTPLAGLRVLIEGHALVTTDASGRFTVSDVEPPYRIIIERSPDTFVVFDGLTAANPTFSTGVSFVDYSASLSGQLEGTDAGRKTAVALVSSDALGLKLTDATGPNQPYTLDATLFKPTASGQLYALDWTPDGAGNAATFNGYTALSGVALADGGAFAGLDLTLNPVPSTHDLVVNASVPGGYDVLELRAGLRPWPADAWGVSMTSAELTSPTLPTTVMVPDLSGARMQISLWVRAPGSTAALGDGVAWKSVPTSVTSVDLAVPARPELLGPADGATGVEAGAEFSWTPPPDAISIFVLHGRIIMWAFTNGSTFTLPDLSPFGSAYGSGTSYTWRVSAFGLGGHEDLDAVLQSPEGRTLMLIVGASFKKPLTEEGYVVTGSSRAFTTP